ncbi:MAG TPA: hypothetical protein GX010_01510 [Erysipelotrichaceae bacterium]|nr:hypothetical protein [Erysipelotrichaceae bacterium]
MKNKKIPSFLVLFLTLVSLFGCHQKENNVDGMTKFNNDPNKASLRALLTFDDDKDNLYKVKNVAQKGVFYDVENMRNDVSANQFYENPSPAYRFDSTVSGKALSFDGYSNFIDMENFFSQTTDFTIDMWVGLRSYDLNDVTRNITPFVECYSTFDDSGFIFGFKKFGTWGVRIKTTAGWQEVWCDETLKLYTWNAVSFSFNAGTVNLYRNGILEKSQFVGDISLSGSETMYIGRNTFNQQAPSVFPYNYLSGAIDEVRIYDKALDAAAIKSLADLYIKDGEIPALSFRAMNYPSNYLNDNVYRTLWHGLPSINWVSDTNGGFYYKGNYHLFFTKSDLGPDLGGQTWGHLVSPDMISWHEVQPAIHCGDNDYDNRWVFAGSGAVINDVPYLFYTGFILDDFSKIFSCTISMCKPKDLNDPDLEQWEKMPEVKLKLPPGFKSDEFRDPQVHIEHDTAFLFIVSRRATGGNPVILGFSAPLNDITNWSYRGVVFEVDYSRHKHLGYMWEVPIFLRLTSPSGNKVKYLLAIAPMNEVGLSNDSIYLLGDFDWETCRYTADNLNAQRYDFGSDYFACSGGQVYDPMLDHIILFETLQCGWNLSGHNRYHSSYSAGFTMGRYYSLDEEGNAVVNHIDYSSIYGKTLLTLNDVAASSLEDYYKVGRSYRLAYKMRLGSESHKAGFEILSNKTGSEAFSFYYDVNKQTFTIDEMKTSNPIMKQISFMDYVFDSNREMEIEVFVDQSCVEIYIDNCRAMSGRAFNNLDCEYIKVLGSDWTINDLVVNEMKRVY